MGEIKTSGGGDADQPVIGFRIGVFNWRLKRARERAGLTMVQLSERAAINIGTLYGIQALKEKPTEAQADRLSATLVVPVDDLFPGLIDELVSRIGTVEVPLTAPQVRALIVDDEDSRVRQIALRQVLLPLLSSGVLTERERYVLVNYTAADRDDRPSLDEIGKRPGWTRERVRQIEAQLLHKLRYPTRSRQLASLL